jgi:preprotein translocase YajC subunit
MPFVCKLAGEIMAEFVAVGVLLVLGLGAYWAFLLFPKQRDFAKRQVLARSLVEGDEIITAGGLVGRVRQIDSKMGVAYVELAEGLEVRVVTAAILDRYDPEAIAENAQMKPTTE